MLYLKKKKIKIYKIYRNLLLAREKKYYSANSTSSKEVLKRAKMLVSFA